MIKGLEVRKQESKKKKKINELICTNSNQFNTVKKSKPVSKKKIRDG